MTATPTHPNSTHPIWCECQAHNVDGPDYEAGHTWEGFRDGCQFLKCPAGCCPPHERVAAIRAHPDVGYETCGYVSETMSDKELGEALERDNALTIEQAVAWAVNHEQLMKEMESNAAWDGPPDTTHEVKEDARPLTFTYKLELPEGMHPTTTLGLLKFAEKLGQKLKAAQDKYGYSDEWAKDDWEDTCHREFQAHVLKGDPKDVAIYAMFMEHHGWSTTPKATHDTEG